MTEPRLFVLGVDGGGTHTRCVAVSLCGYVLAEAEAGPSNYLRVGAEAAAVNVLAAVAGALDAAGASLPAAAACVCLAGVGRPENHAAMLPRFRHLAARVMLDTDATAALAGAHALAPGVVVIAGTGAVAWGRGADGEIVRSDGWGPVLGDEGSGYWIGAEVLHAVTRAADGRGPQTRLVAATLGHFGLTGATELVNHLRWGEHSSAEVAELAAVCSRVAAQGDDVAEAVLTAAGLRLAESCAAALTALEGDTPPVALTGSVFGDPVVQKAFRESLSRRHPAAEVHEPRLRPVLGAALLALEASGVPVCDEILARMEPGLVWPGPGV